MIGRRAKRYAGVLSSALAMLLVAVALGSCSSSGESSTRFPAGPINLDPADDSHLVVTVGSCTRRAEVDVEESSKRIALLITGRRAPDGCQPEVLDVHLAASLGHRTLIDRVSGQERTAEPPPTGPLPAPPRLPADCSAESVREAVEREVDGGLMFHALACDGTWMAVDTSTNACPANGETIAPACRANQHLGYFRNIENIWRVVGFDDCAMVRVTYPDLPDEICQE